MSASRTGAPSAVLGKSASETSAASPAKVPTLSWKDDYGTRHPLAPPKAPALSWKDDYGTRHPEERP